MVAVTPLLAGLYLLGGGQLVGAVVIIPGVGWTWAWWRWLDWRVTEAYADQLEARRRAGAWRQQLGEGPH